MNVLAWFGSVRCRLYAGSESLDMPPSSVLKHAEAIVK